MNTLHQVLAADLEEHRRQGILKGQERVISAIVPGKDGLGPRVLLAGQGQTPYLRMNSNSYLGLDQHPAPAKAAEEAVARYGVGHGAVRFISGTMQPHIDLESELARFHERPAAMIFSSAYAAVLGVLAPLITPETAVISDELNHNSIINGLRLATPAVKKIYGHLDMAELEKCITECQGQVRRVLIVSDGIFSMRGDHAPLAAITSLRDRYGQDFAEGILTIIDDSHGVGVFGATGRGCEEFCRSRVDLVIGTLGKAFGVNGGYVTGAAELIGYLRESAACYIYSNPITPAEAAAARCSVELVAGPEGAARLGTLRRLTRHLEQGLIELGFQIIESDHPIVPVVTGDTGRNRRLADFLFAKNILVTPLSYPVVPRGADEIRLQVSAAHAQQDIDFLLDVLQEFAEAGS
ncbi:MAG: 7-keto-8-aminopelargonate synthetase [Desulfobulbaceae bacterium]|nr:MAG: 7-keto-8-aminopelargonate synthetase [Desulfobulbaceae bacterium]